MLASHIHLLTRTGIHTCMHMGACVVKLRFETIGLFFPQVWRAEKQDRASVCAFVGGCQKRLVRKPRTSQIPKFPKGHAVKYTNHKCLALSNRFRTLCMSKQTQHCLWVRLHYIYICLGISYFKLNNTVPFSCECYDNNTLWSIFCIENVLFFWGFLAK